MPDESVTGPGDRVAELERDCARLRDALVASETRLSVLFNHFLDSILIVDATSGKILLANRAAVSFFQYSRAELMAREFSVLFPEDRETDRSALLQKLRVHGHVYVEQQFVRKDGQVVQADLSAVMVKWDNDIAFLLTISDATDRKAVESEKVATERVLSRLETIVRLGREIRNPLQELLTHVELERDEAIKAPVLRIASILKLQREQETLLPVGQAESTCCPLAVPSGRDLKPPRDGHILIVDDEPSICRLFRRALTRRFPACQVDVAGNGAEALPLFKNAHHAIVIMDVEMPVMAGDAAFAAIADICEQEQWEMPKVVFCTGFDLPPSIRSVVQASTAHTCLLKPVNVDVLTDELESRMRVGIREEF